MQWPAEAIWEAVSPRLPGFTMEILPEIGSTNTELMQRARAGRAEPVLLVAERQTAGRGRLGRAWHSVDGDASDDLPALTFSLGLPLVPADWSGLSLAVGLAVAQALDPAGHHIGLKWPNDLWVQGRKLAGILIETAPLPEGAAPGSAAGVGLDAGAGALARYAVIGIGINLAPREVAGLSTPPAALREWWPQAQAGEVLGRVAAPLAQAILEFQQAGFAPRQAAYAARDVLQGRPLRLATAAGERLVTSAEVSVRPVGAA